MSYVVAGIGEIEGLDQRFTQRCAKNFRCLKFSKGVDGLTFHTEPNNDYFSSYCLIVMLIDSKLTVGMTREDVWLALYAKNIESCSLWYSMSI
jgi:hypothetical protein